MRLKLVTLLSLCLLLSAVFQQVTLAQDESPARTIPITSKGFGAKLSPDGKTLVTFENTVLLDLKEVDPTLLPMRVFDVSSGQQVGTLSGFSDFAADVAFTSDGSQMVSAHMNGDFHIWDMTSMKVVKSFQEPVLGFTQVEFFPDNKRILVLAAGIPARFLVIDSESGAITQTLGIHFDSYIDFQNNYVQFPAQGDILVAGYGLSPDGTLLATSSANDEVRIWTVADNQYQVVRKKSDQYGLFSVRQLSFTPDNKSLIYYDATEKLTHIWDVAGKSEKTFSNFGSDTFILSPDGTMMAWLNRPKDGQGSVSIAPVDAPDKATTLFTLPDGLAVAPRISWVYFTPDGKQVVAGGWFADDVSANQIYVLDVPS